MLRRRHVKPLRHLAALARWAGGEHVCSSIRGALSRRGWLVQRKVPRPDTSGRRRLQWVHVYFVTEHGRALLDALLEDGTAPKLRLVPRLQPAARSDATASRGCQ